MYASLDYKIEKIMKIWSFELCKCFLQTNVNIRRAYPFTLAAVPNLYLKRLRNFVQKNNIRSNFIIWHIVTTPFWMFTIS